MLIERAVAIPSPLQKCRRLQTRGSKMPSGKKRKTLPFALYRQKNRSFEPFAMIAEEHVSDARLGCTSIPTAVSAFTREGWLGLSVADARPQT